MRREPHVRFCERAAVGFLRATHLICHCKSAEEARALWGAIADRFAACKLVLHPQKTKIVYCKDVNRRSDFPDIYFDFLGFQFRARKIMSVKPDGRILAYGFPANRAKNLGISLAETSSSANMLQCARGGHRHIALKLIFRQIADDRH